jgi:superfamily II DNA or RNA helicase
VLIVPNIMLVEQMRREFIEYGWTACDDYLTIMYMNHVPDIQKPVLVSTYQSLVKQDDSFISRYNAAIVDEAHQAPANSIKTILGKLTYADYRLGMTGTFPDHTDPEELSKIYEIYGWLGPLVAQKSASELMDEGWLSRLKIANIIIKYPEIMCLKNANRAYEEEIITTTQNEIRNRVFGYILNHIPETENTIILCYLREHLEFIHDYLVQNFSSKFKIRKIHGDIAAEKRIKIQVEAETTGGIVIAATYGTMSIGVNIKRLHNIIMGSSHKGKIKIIQTIGRGLRLHETKDWLTMFDIVDDLRWEKRNRQRKKNGKIGLNHLWKHFEQRLKHYEYQKYPYTTKVIKLEDLQ